MPLVLLTYIFRCWNSWGSVVFPADIKKVPKACAEKIGRNTVVVVPFLFLFLCFSSLYILFPGHFTPSAPPLLPSFS